MAMENGLSVADALALGRGNDGGFLGMNGSGGGILALIIVFILLFGNGGFGGYGGSNALTQAEMQRGFDTQTINQKLNEIGNGVCSLGYENANLINGVNMTVMQSTNALGSAITDVGYQVQNGTCSVNRNIDSLRYDAQLNTRDITDAIHCEGQATRALINDNTIQQLREDLQSAQLTLANANQTQNLLNAIGRYVTNPPCYQNYGCGCGCNTGVTIA